MTETDYVTEDVARKLREKGFKEKCRGYFYNGFFCFSCFHNEYNKTCCADTLISAPSLAQAAKWLRDTYAIWVTVFPKYSYRYELVEYRVRIASYTDLIDGKKGRLLPVWCDGYNGVLNEGIKEALKMI